MDDGGWRCIGAHKIRAEAPDLIFLQDRGDVSPSEMSAILEEGRKVAEASGGPPFWLNDMSELGHVPSETRKLLTRSDLLLLLKGAAVIGASLPQRAIVQLVLHAARLAYPGKQLPPVRFFATEAEARAWLAEARRAAAPAPSSHRVAQGETCAAPRHADRQSSYPSLHQ